MATRASGSAVATPRRRILQQATTPSSSSPPIPSTSQAQQPIEDLSPEKVRNDATDAWSDDLKTLCNNAEERFPDISWTTAPPLSPTSSPKAASSSAGRGSRVVFAHRAIVLARAPKTFTAKYLELPAAIRASDAESSASPSVRRSSTSSSISGSGKVTAPTKASSARTTAPRKSALRPSAPPRLQGTPRGTAPKASSSSSSIRKPAKATSPLSSPPLLSLASSVDSILSTPSAASTSSEAGTEVPLSSGDLDFGLLKRSLTYIYTSETTASDGDLADALREDALPIDASAPERLERLRSDMFSLWQSRHLADITIRVGGSDSNPESSADRSPRPRGMTNLADLPSSSSSAIALPMEDAGDEETAGVFSAHRFVLASRSPYFAAQLLSGSFSDSTSREVTLPSPPFTPTATYFTLGFLYTGALSFSPRTFDLTTAFQIWRASAYLQVKSLSSLVGSMIFNDFCHKFVCGASTASPPCTTCVKRVPRTLAFAASPDVADATLRAAGLKAVGGLHFGAYWSREVGAMDPSLRSKIVAQIKARLNREAGSVVPVLSQLLRVERMLEGERSSKWTDNLRAMLEAIAEHAKQALLGNLEEVVASSEWDGMIEGVGLLTDVLERLLSIITSSLAERNAAQVYSVLVAQVLLKGEEGMSPGPMRDQVELARQDVLSFLRKRWVNVRANAGFNGLEKWLLKEIAGEIEVPAEELLLPEDDKATDGAKSKTGLKASPTNPAARRATVPTSTPSRRPAGAASRPAVRADEGEREAGPVNLRAAVLNRNAAKSSVTHGFRSGTTAAATSASTSSPSSSTTRRGAPGIAASRATPARPSAPAARRPSNGPTSPSASSGRAATTTSTPLTARQSRGSSPLSSPPDRPSPLRKSSPAASAQSIDTSTVGLQGTAEPAETPVPRNQPETPAAEEAEADKPDFSSEVPAAPSLTTQPEAAAKPAEPLASDTPSTTAPIPAPSSNKPARPALGSRVAGLAARFSGQSHTAPGQTQRPFPSAASSSSARLPGRSRSSSPIKDSKMNRSEHTGTVKRPASRPASRPSSRPASSASTGGAGAASRSSSSSRSRQGSRAGSPAVRAPAPKTQGSKSAERSADAVPSTNDASTKVKQPALSSDGPTSSASLTSVPLHLTPSAAEPWQRGASVPSSSDAAASSAATKGPSHSATPSRAASVANLASLRASVRRRNVSMMGSASRASLPPTVAASSEDKEEMKEEAKDPALQADTGKEEEGEGQGDESAAPVENKGDEPMSPPQVLTEDADEEGAHMPSQDGEEAGKEQVAAPSRDEEQGAQEPPSRSITHDAESGAQPEEEGASSIPDNGALEDLASEAPNDVPIPTSEANESVADAAVTIEDESTGTAEANEPQTDPNEAAAPVEPQAEETVESDPEEAAQLEPAGEDGVPALQASPEIGDIPAAQLEAFDANSLRSRDSNETLMVPQSEGHGFQQADEQEQEQDSSTSSSEIATDPNDTSASTLIEDAADSSNGFSSPAKCVSLAPGPHTPKALRKMPLPGGSGDDVGEESLDRTPRPSRPARHHAPPKLSADDDPDGSGAPSASSSSPPSKTTRPPLRIRSPASATAYANHLAAAFPAACLSIGIPCLIWPSGPPFPPRTRLRALVKYIGPVEGYAGPMVGVEVPMPLPRALRGRLEGAFGDGCAGGVRYFSLARGGSEVASDAASLAPSRTSSIASRDPHDRSGASTPSTTPFLPAPPTFSDSSTRAISPAPPSAATQSGTSRLSEHLDMFARAEREARRRRIARLHNRAAEVLAASAASASLWSASAPVSPEPDDFTMQRDGLPLGSSSFFANGSNRSMSLAPGSGIGFPSGPSSIPFGGHGYGYSNGHPASRAPPVAPIPRYAPGVPLRIASDSLVPTKATTTTAMQRNASATATAANLAPFPSMSPPSPVSSLSSASTSTRNAGPASSVASAFLSGYGLAIERERRASWSPELALAMASRSNATSPRGGSTTGLSPPHWRTNSTASSTRATGVGPGSGLAARRLSRPASRSSRRSRRSSMFMAFGDGHADEEEEEEDERDEQGSRPGLGLFVRPDEVMWVFEDE
ncbi:hypothetical protein BDZ90DRAFT_228960 [Jaminaea rosea]|uniref:BTB domain-containing protein n=1 Tax=Jaminaea rosea TaxID=1569628 RepID=A0A316UY42_9BASI|nr:hypothetical protein BDZ90DRAFT_228960 [Jaminaea rosea]PWN29914.1 hypothetical protein BDZ90DRAFT_228960 [Jaminaea rosea]